LQNDAEDVVEDLRDIGKLGSGFGSVNELEEIDIGSKGQRRPTYLNTNLTQEQRAKMGELLKEPGSCGASFAYQMRISAL
jgi:hypothetical protein